MMIDVKKLEKAVLSHVKEEERLGDGAYDDTVMSIYEIAAHTAALTLLEYQKMKADDDAVSRHS